MSRGTYPTYGATARVVRSGQPTAPRSNTTARGRTVAAGPESGRSSGSPALEEAGVRAPAAAACRRGVGTGSVRGRGVVAPRRIEGHGEREGDPHGGFAPWRGAGWRPNSSGSVLHSTCDSSSRSRLFSRSRGGG
ncbi:hypothetical protein ZWY2020_053631 [Hordeum vulgare]|nr:hypothetical protein ZWY2020_053631 [Hordeum vulgare]